MTTEKYKRIMQQLEKAAELLADPRAENLLRTDPAELLENVNELRKALESNKLFLIDIEEQLDGLELPDFGELELEPIDFDLEPLDFDGE